MSNPAAESPRRFAQPLAAGTGLSLLLALLTWPASATDRPPAGAWLAVAPVSAGLAQSRDSGWTLDKSGSVQAGTVTWQISASPAGVMTNTLMARGEVLIRNVGARPATLGNIVVDLQTRTGTVWTTRASNVANASLGDGATSALVLMPSDAALDADDNRPWAMSAVTVSEDAASGALSFTQGAAAAPFSLVPQVLLAPGATLRLQFQARFDNAILAIPEGQSVRTRILVTSGNAGQGPRTLPDLDINGNGQIDADEARVRSKARGLPARRLPAPTTGADPVLSDTLADLTTTGTVTFTNAVLNIGATSGTVQATVNGGASGGTIKNCAHLTGSGISLEACNAQSVPPASGPFEWMNGDVVTLPQVDWGSASILSTLTPFSTVYPLGLLVGVVGVPNQYSILLSSGSETLSYLPTYGASVALTQNYVDPVVPAGGVFGGDIVALRLNVDFGAAGLIGGTFHLGDLYLCGLTTPAAVNGSTVHDFIAIANTLLSGASAPGVAIADAAPLAAQLNAAFMAGVPSTFAHDHLSPTPCPSQNGDLWQDGDVITYWQNSWGEAPNGSNAAQLLKTNYNAVYASTSGILALGLPARSMTFSSPLFLLSFLPSVGLPGPLTGFNDNPSSTTSGSFGGDVIALRLNVDFADAGVISGASPTRFGDLTLCAFPTLPLLEELSVREFLVNVNSLLGGGPGTYDIGTLLLVLDALNQAFQGGVVSQYARDHLVVGSCP